MADHDPEDVLSFWFGELDESGAPSEARRARWWKKSPELDAEIRERFEPVRDALCAGELEGWRETRRGRLAYVILLDQLSRNMYRDTPRMYEEDERAVEAALEAIEAGDPERLRYHERWFLYMPLMHAEDLKHQERCVALFAELGERFPEHGDGGHGYAVRHRDIVARFGRFPHRNEILGRESTDEERAFLEEPGSSF